MGVSGYRHAPAALPLGKGRGTNFMEGWVGPTAGLDGCRKFRSHLELISGPSSP